MPPSCSVSGGGGTDQPFSYSFLTLVGRDYIGQLKIPHIRPEVVFKPIMHRESKMVLHRPRQGFVIQVALPPRLLFCPQAGTMTASSHGVRLTRSAFIKAIWHSSLGHVSSDQSTRKGLQPSWPWSILRLVHISGQRLYFGKSACPVFELGIAASADTGMTSL